MSEDEAFVCAIQEDRDDAARRLVYADWLEERNDPRNEYLRLGCELAKTESRMASLREQIENNFPNSAMIGVIRLAATRSLRSGASYSHAPLRRLRVAANPSDTPSATHRAPQRGRIRKPPTPTPRSTRSPPIRDPESVPHRARSFRAV